MGPRPLPSRSRRGTLVLVHEADEVADLATGLRASEPWAERALVDRFSNGVATVIVNILGRSADVDDLVQEVFVRAFLRVDRLEDHNVRPWLNAFAVNVAREEIRRRRRRWWLTFRAPAELPVVPSEDGGSPEHQAAVAALYRLLDQMDADDRIAVSLRLIEGMTIDEIAQATGSSPATVKRRVRRGRTWLQKRARRDPRLSHWVGEP